VSLEVGCSDPHVQKYLVPQTADKDVYPVSPDPIQGVEASSQEAGNCWLASAPTPATG